MELTSQTHSDVTKIYQLEAYLVQTSTRLKVTLKSLYKVWRASRISIMTYLLIVGSVSMYDIYLTVKYAESLAQLEVNPVGRWLMNLDHLEMKQIPDVTLFVGCKAMGTILVLIVLSVLATRFARLGHPIAMGVSFCQLVLGYFLTFSLTSSLA